MADIRHIAKTLNAYDIPRTGGKFEPELITTSYCKDRLFVEFPFELKDLFRKCFPYARWHPESLAWSVDTYCQERLFEWIDIIRESGVLGEIRKQHELALAKSEKNELKKELENLRLLLGEQNENATRKERKKQYLEELHKEIAALRDQLAITLNEPNAHG